MATNPTGAMTFQDLIIETAIKLGVAFYGTDGDEEAQVPTNAHDLSMCKLIVNSAIRMFLANAPPNGWRCQHPVASLTLWASVALEAAATAAWVTSTAYTVGDKVTDSGESYVCLVAHTSGTFATDLAAAYWRETYDCTGVYEPSTDTTLITASGAVFYDSMELKSIVVTDVDTLTIATYVSTTAVRVAGDHNWTGSKTFSITSDGDYTLPRTFGGEVSGEITYAADTSPTVTIAWRHESVIRHLREVTTSETGYSYLAATRKMDDDGDRWELLTWPVPNSTYVVEFPYELYFNKLVGLTESHPCGHAHDEAIKAACFAVLERDGEDMIGDLMRYYREIALPDSFKIDGRQAPRNLGKMRSGSRGRRGSWRNFREHRPRPSVAYDINTP